VAGLGDRDDDGFLDVGIGAPGSDLAGTDAGAIYVVFGPATGTVDLGDELVFTGDVGDRAGTCVANAGDVDADGQDDLLAVGTQSTGAATGWAMLAP
jgi:hypothetical protein